MKKISFLMCVISSALGFSAAVAHGFEVECGKNPTITVEAIRVQVKDPEGNILELPENSVSAEFSAKYNSWDPQDRDFIIEEESKPLAVQYDKNTNAYVISKFTHSFTKRIVPNTSTHCYDVFSGIEIVVNRGENRLKSLNSFSITVNDKSRERTDKHWIDTSLANAARNTLSVTLDRRDIIIANAVSTMPGRSYNPDFSICYADYLFKRASAPSDEFFAMGSFESISLSKSEMEQQVELWKKIATLNGPTAKLYGAWMSAGHNGDPSGPSAEFVTKCGDVGPKRVYVVDYVELVQ